MTQAYIGIGSNLGDRTSYCKRALDEIAGFSRITKVSSLYETDPVGKEDQPEFINCIAEIQTDLSAQDLLKKLNLAEEKLGRVRHEKWGPRTIDLDIIFYGNLVINEENLEIPHPRAHLRRFVLEPLCEIMPDFIHPKLGLSASQLLGKIDDNKSVIKKNGTIHNSSTLIHN